MAVLDFERAIEAEPELADLDVVLPPERVNPDWAQPGGSASKAMGPLAMSGRFEPLFEVRIGKGSSPLAWLNAPPVVAANRLFAIDTEARVSAFTADTGRPLWSVRLERGREGTRPAFGGGVSSDGDRVFATTGLGTAVALDAATGRELWRVNLGTPLRSAPTVGAGRVLVMAQDNRLTALAADTGEELWQVTATLEPAAILGPAAPALEAGTVVAGFSSGELFALRVENGRTVWQDQLARTGRTTALGALSAIVASPVIDRGRVYAIGHGGRMVAIDLASGQRVWERNFAGVSTPAVAGEFLFVLTTENELLALTRRDGKIRWVTRLPRWRKPKSRQGAIHWAGPVLAGGRLVLVSSRGRMALVDPATGAIAEERPLRAPASLPPIVANTRLYVLTDDGRIRAFR
ncbi:MAG: PQQ-like beta-propeller repeat protein [Sphingomonadaceae bacterium]|uniref:outer membrane protein assembly factor BamB family protein n=1 Tax=Thermaurantiacus sp. TaxID=2820283 RepID=UPI00298F1982|nr:PQQ-binding-like beta-propeller repeat protein [Thermaurantiacus sp.]MCS6986458.1 PQQ-like beta-propeller repeat protein [Sphingomonadaceae bacterium]MDW8414281.1 PQQ-binding-like beta-propeller repeat protein [Thermaurantiacus sp.]